MNIKKEYYYISKSIQEKIDVCELNKDIMYELLSYFCYNTDDFVEIPAEIFKSITKNYKDYLNFLIMSKIIYIDNTYVVGQKPRGYKMRDDLNGEIVKIEITNPKFIKQKKELNNKQINQIKNMDNTTMKIMREEFKKYVNKLDVDKILNMVNQLQNQYRTQVNQYMIADKIKMNRLYFHRNTTNNRLDSSITGMKKDYKFIFKQEEYYTNIDLKNSSAYFLYFILLRNTFDLDIKHNIAIDLTPSAYNPDLLINQEQIENEFSYEVMEYKKLVESGRFYDDLAGYFNTDREEMKKIIMRIFFSENSLYKNEKQIFRSIFPNIYDFIYNFKDRYNNKRFAILLQKMESYYVIDKICPKLIENNIVPVTVHDSFIIPTKDKEKTIEIILSQFPSYYHPSLSVIDYN